MTTEARRKWTFLTNHGHVLVYVHRNPDARVRDIATAVGITERAAQTILSDLEGAGYLRKTKVGRRNTYSVNTKGAFRHPEEAGHRIGDLLNLFD
ncbi:MAG TPA: helix-turn-helix domain-containing protein [Actinomycetota bacterium]|jgi:DNA-binding MarR family transcriptional regulator|nr:helix-turn-helix domain-containing protein [Actinomycetota bacterium]HRY10355.1 helix-turn-helix domain-containing protein [Candidatus Nanopelagicales bacterium]